MARQSIGGGPTIDTQIRRMTGWRAHRERRRTQPMAVMTGTIKRLVRDKGFGFIAAGGQEEFFFHSSACTGPRFDELREGQSVSFDVGRGPKGPRAENVRAE